MDNKEVQKTEETPKRRSFYVDDNRWYRFQSKLRAEKSNASKWIREMIDWYLEEG